MRQKKISVELSEHEAAQFDPTIEKIEPAYITPLSKELLRKGPYAAKFGDTVIHKGSLRECTDKAVEFNKKKGLYSDIIYTKYEW